MTKRDQELNWPSEEENLDDEKDLDEEIEDEDEYDDDEPLACTCDEEPEWCPIHNDFS